MTGRGLVTTQAGLPGDIALPSSCAKPSEAGAADLAARLGPDLARCAPTSLPPGARGPQVSARLPPPVWRRPGCSGAAGGGRLPAGLRNYNSCGRTRAGSQASEAELGPLGSWKAPKFPQRVTQPFFLSPGGSPRCQSTARGCGPPANRAWRLPLPPVPRPRFSGAPRHPNTHQPRRLLTPSGRTSLRLLTSREEGEGLSQGEVARRPAEARWLLFLH